ncbi:hypothetical protein [Erythrobacter aureus]|uniref:Type II secretion system protein n=1 Tax=Erythrobacter aureus TaxID=2182384 RepID=A0A345YJL3_9SPHN|nr:hypothetical protein [Erythrobacter aureus]AXK44115.1 hypothetical protein DVR09_16820 [Erythrobacter aureus]
MSNVLLGIMGTILFIGLALAGVVFIGPEFMDTKIDAEASGYLNQRSQIAYAIESYASENGKLPLEAGKEPIDLLVEKKFLTRAPAGGSSQWSLNSADNSLITPVAGPKAHATKICVAARAKAKMAQPENIYKCDGSDAPGGRLSAKDPCCLM